MSEATAITHELTGDRMLIAFNPIAGSGGRQAKVARLVDALVKSGLQGEICDRSEALLDRALDLQSRGELRGVVAAGGDGTASMAMNMLPGSIPLATFPLGTENLLAKYLGHTSGPDAMARLLFEGRTIALDAGEANGKLFSLMA